MNTARRIPQGLYKKIQKSLAAEGDPLSLPNRVDEIHLYQANGQNMKLLRL
jgi:hypothetical protein